MNWQVGRKLVCTGCDATWLEGETTGVVCPRCGKPPPPRVGPPRRVSMRPPLAPPGGLLDRIIDDGCDLLGEDSLEALARSESLVGAPPRVAPPSSGGWPD